MSKMSKIDQMHLRAVMLCMSKMSKMGKEQSSTYIALQPLGAFDLSLTSSTCFNIHSIGSYGWKALSLSFPKIFAD